MAVRSAGFEGGGVMRGAGYEGGGVVRRVREGGVVHAVCVCSRIFR